LVCGDNSIFRKDPVIIEVNPSFRCEVIFDILKNKFKKDYIGFRGEAFINRSDLISNTLGNGDRIIASSLKDDDELRVEIRYKGTT